MDARSMVKVSANEAFISISVILILVISLTDRVYAIGEDSSISTIGSANGFSTNSLLQFVIFTKSSITH
jgi:hypothetical protein